MTANASNAQVNIYASDIEAIAAFYKRLGLAEKFRYPITGVPEHIELLVGTFTLGLTSKEALSRLTGLPTTSASAGAELVLWCTDSAQLYAKALEHGAQALFPPKAFNGRLLAAWVQDPEGNRVKLVSHLELQNKTSAA